MEMTTVLVLNVCIVCMAIGSVDAQVTLNPSEASVSLGEPFNFTVVSTEPVDSGLILFRRVNPSVTLCVWDMSTEIVVRNEPGYGCGTTDVANTYYFVIFNVTRADSGIWSAQYGLQKTSNSVLEVRFPPTVEIKPVSPCVSPTYVEGQKDVSLNCMVTSANPAPSAFRWYHRNQLVGEGQIYTISTVTRSSAGVYRCSAENGEAPHGKDTVKVKVHYAPIVTVPTETQIVKEFSDLDIPCTADANPNVTSLVWTREGVSGILPATEGVLHLKNLKRSDTGTYICTANNTVKSCELWPTINKSTAGVNVEVLYKPNITSFGIVNKEQQRRVTVAEGDKVIFLCQADSFPPPDMTIWSADRIKNQTQQHISLSYTLGSADCYDSGNYTCSVKNVLGEVLSDNTELLVKYSPRPVDPKSSALTVTADLNEDADFIFDVIAHPKPDFTLKSTKGAQLIYNVKIVWDGLLAKGTFNLFKVTMEQLGTYILTVNNTEGSRDFSVTLQESFSLITTTEKDPVASREDIKMSLGLGVGIGVAAIMVVIVLIVVKVFIYRRNVAWGLRGNHDNQGTVSFQAAGETLQVNNEKNHEYDMPGNKNEDLVTDPLLLLCLTGNRESAKTQVIPTEN